MTKYRTISQFENFCGETPVYLEESNCLYWIDSGRPYVFNYNLESDKMSRKELDFSLEGLVPRSNGGWIAPSQDTIVFYDHDFVIEKIMDTILPVSISLAFHDCTAGPDDCLYIGAYDAKDYTSARGRIYRVSSDLQVRISLEGLALPNGTGFSPDNKIFYVNEMMASRILAYDYNSSTCVFSGKRIFSLIPPEEGYPDGLRIDEDGCLWIALWQGAKILKLNDKGKRIKEIEMPVPSPTNISFCGKNLDKLYITSAIKGLSDEQHIKYPESGSLFCVTETVKGLATRKLSW